MLFKNREEAGCVLAQRLAPYKSQKPVVLAVSNGALPMAQKIAEVLQAELDVILVKKIAAPADPEFTIGALSESGEFHLAEMGGGLSRQYLENRAKAEFAKLIHKRKQYSTLKSPVGLNKKTVIIIDEGIATSETVLAAIEYVRRQNPEKIIVGTIVSTFETIKSLKKECDEVIVLYTPVLFSSVGTYFEKCPKVTNKDVERILIEESKNGLVCLY